MAIVIAAVIAGVQLTSGDGNDGPTEGKGPTVTSEAAEELVRLDDAHHALGIDLDRLDPGDPADDTIERVGDVRDQVDEAGSAIADIDAETNADSVLLDMIDEALDKDDSWLEALDTALNEPTQANADALEAAAQDVEDAWQAVDDASDGEIAIEPDGTVPAVAWVKDAAAAQAEQQRKARAKAKAKAQAKARARAKAKAEAARRAAATATVSCSSTSVSGWPVTSVSATGTDCGTASAVINGMSGAGSDTVTTGYSAAGFSCSLISGDPAITYAGQSWNYSCSSGSRQVGYTLTNPGG